MFLSQIIDWRKFREYQLKVRRYYIQDNRFPEYQQKVRERRRRHGLKGDAKLLHDRDEQSKLDNWMEYQDYKYEGLEYLEKKVGQAQEKLDSAQRALGETGLPGFEGIYEPDNFGNNYALCVQTGNEDWEASRKRVLIQGELELAKKD